MAGADAQAGFYYQNLVAALRTLDLIEFGSQVKSITLENPSRAIHIDDIIVETNDVTEFVQVKWAEDENTAFTLANLVTAQEDGKSCLLRKLAIGYQQIASEPGNKVVVLLSTKKAGTTKQPAKGFNHSLQSFINEFHQPFIENTTARDISTQPNYSEFQATLTLLQNAAELPDGAEFSTFIKSLRFSLNEPDRELLTHRLHGRLQQLGIEERQFGTLLDEILKWSLSATPYSAQDVLRVLGLLDRFSARLSHQFPVDETTWVQTPAVFQALDDALDNLDQGFILVEGEPGAGKSTALTKYLQQRDDISFGYFCFVPDEVSLGNERLGEAAFLQSVCSGLKKSFPDFEFSTPYAEQDINLLNSWLKELSENNRRVVFVVDGVDHVDRKSKQSLISRPLTAVLDGGLPANVLIILTSRYPQAAPQSVVDHIKLDARRHIKMPRFDSNQVESFLRLRGLLLEGHTLDTVINVSQGVPIYLEYLVGKLLPMHEFQQEEYLKSSPTMSNNQIDHFHEHIWKDVADEELSEYILAILAIREEFTPPKVLQRLLKYIGLPVTLSGVNRVLVQLNYLLRTSDAKEVSIRHSSLADFVVEKTQEQRSEIVEAIISWYEQEPDTDEAWRNRFRFFLEIGEYQKVLDGCNDNWFDQAWNAHRPLTEVQRNLSFAWQAALKSKNLVAFTRIGLMKQRTGLIKENISNQQISLARSLLDIGHTDIALNYVWDGERPIASELAFAKFVLLYKERTGRQLPDSILKAGLRVERRPHGDMETLSTCYRALSYIIDIKILLEQIAEIQWRSDDDHSHVIDAKSTEENQASNATLQHDVLKELANNSRVQALYALVNDDELHPILKNASFAALAVGLALIDEIQDVKTTLSKVDWGKLPVAYNRWVALTLIPLGVSCPAMSSKGSRPRLPKLILKDYNFNPAFNNLFEQIHYYFLCEPEAQSSIDTVLTKIKQPVRAIISALADLASISIKHHKQKVVPPISAFINIADKLDIDERSFTGRNQRDSGALEYRCNAYRFYSSLWSCAKFMLSDDDFIKLAQKWQQKDNGRSCTFYIIATRSLAFTLTGIQTDAAQQLTFELLQVTEQCTRQDEDTMILTDALLKSARAWGKCGFKDEAQRLWQEVATVACGVGERKDYQVTEIINMIELAHKQDPDNTINRLAEQLDLAYQLEETGNARQLAISVEYILASVAKHWPGLAIKGLMREDDSIFREQAIHHLIRILSKQHVDKQLLLAIVMTLNRWKDYSYFTDQTLPAMSTLFEAALNSKEDHIARQLYDVARHMFVIEKQIPEEISRWASVWQGHGTAPPDVIADIPQFKSNKPVTTEDRMGFDEWDEDLEQTLISFDVKDIGKLEAFLEPKSQEAHLKNQMNNLNRSNRDWLKAIEKLASDVNWDDKNQDLVSELLQPFYKDAATKLHLPLAVSREEIVKLVPALFKTLNQRLTTQLEHKEIENVFNFDAWMKGIHFPPSASFSYSVQRALQKRLQTWIEQAPYSQMVEWEIFCRKRCSGDTQTRPLVAIASRVAKSDKAKALALLTEAMNNAGKLIFMDTEFAAQIFKSVIKLDKEIGIEFVLTSFINQFEDAPGMIVNYLPDAIEWLADSIDADFVALFEVWNKYNRQLTAGLSNKQTDTSWLINNCDKSFETAAIEYLVDLLQYPQVDVRLLAVEALINAIRANSKYIESIKTCWPNCNDGQKEYIASCFDSLGRIEPASSNLWADWLVECAEKENHYNIRASAVSAITQLSEVVVPLAVSKAKVLLEQPVIARINTTILSTQSNYNLRYLPPYLAWAIEGLADTSTEDVLFETVLLNLPTEYSNLENGFRQEMVVHRRHNMNSNFDNLEISGAYGDAARSATNQALVSMIQSHTADLNELNENADLLRLRDPSDSLVKKTSPPAGITQMDLEQSDEAFLAFDDWDKIFDTLVSPTTQWKTLFECTEQRTDCEMKHTKSRVNKVRIEIFGAPRSINVDMLEMMVARAGLFHERNLYRFELNDLDAIENTGPLMPLVVTSSRHFRGRPDIEIAAASGNLRNALHLQKSDGDHFGCSLAGTSVVRSTEWQGPYDQDRRMHEPRSSGFLLQIDRETLLQLAESLKIDLWAKLTIERTTDKFETETQKPWETKAGFVCLTQHSI